MVLPWMLGLLLLHAIFFAGCLGIGRVPTPFQARAARLKHLLSRHGPICTVVFFLVRGFELTCACLVVANWCGYLLLSLVWGGCRWRDDGRLQLPRVALLV